MDHENELWPQDEALFSTMAHRDLPAPERRFFETMREKMLDENAPWPETLVWEQDNPDHLYFLRQGYDEFMLGKGVTREEWQTHEIHTMNLAEVLGINLKEVGLLDKDLTLLQWLEENKFEFVRYDHINDGNKIE